MLYVYGDRREGIKVKYKSKYEWTTAPKNRTTEQLDKLLEECGATNENTIVIIHPPNKIPSDKPIYIAEIIRSPRINVSSSIRKLLTKAPPTVLEMSMPLPVQHSFEKRYGRAYTANNRRTIPLTRDERSFPTKKDEKPHENCIVSSSTPEDLPPLASCDDDKLSTIRSSDKTIEKVREAEHNLRMKRLGEQLPGIARGRRRIIRD